MKYIQSSELLELPEGVSVQIKSRIITVTGPRGQLSKNLRHIDVTFTKISDKQIKITVHNGDRKHVATLRTVKSLIANLVKGVTVGFKYKMRFVYAHFPINVNVVNEDGQEFVEIRNFLGEKRLRKVKVWEGCKATISTAQKDELIVEGNSLENVSQTCADIQQICRVRNKDIRKFLDGIYVSEKGHIRQQQSKQSADPAAKKSVRKFFESRREQLEKVDKFNSVTFVGSMNAKEASFFCDVCNRRFKDDLKFVEHLNSKEHLVNSGISSEAELQREVTLDQVKERLKQLKAKMERTREKAPEVDFATGVQQMREKYEQEKQKRKAKKRKRHERQDPDVDGEDLEIKKLMGFGSFKK
ncbi:hypothetical protein KL921_001091 [Ogataea angusta]|uniref:C2H2-type domain-containing protein n=1 Tax=Pichia angusta TaxID=870730 RepID=A0AAN6I7B0_PICAN|nr:uncharacterized protein KL928_001258 [Ogataea angusta]KAG7813545.1 hypothetical protein KL921_001091 [Ogataea angusta]KAG7821174.1 hypothetical protein KL928_001258 [Ogataea angusta]KAG7832129.1 hypothetical protein KL920_000464 [Ogataea angusta]KAG7863773.1 hypothetical protein KL919_001088 [Ogataea angusta]